MQSRYSFSLSLANSESFCVFWIFIAIKTIGRIEFSLDWSNIPVFFECEERPKIHEETQCNGTNPLNSQPPVQIVSGCASISAPGQLGATELPRARK